MSTAARAHPQDLITQSSMTRMQISTIALCIFINMLDGFDLLAVGYVAPLIAADWGVGPGQLGIIFASGGFGMIIGAFFLGPIADYKGRRFTVLMGLCFTTTGMLAAVFATSIGHLVVARIITGIGIGTILASINTLVAEYASDKYRNLCITFLHLGLPLGGAACGVVAGILLESYAWNSVFLFGGLLSLVMVPVCLYALPESIDFLTKQRGDDALGKINHVLRRMGYVELDEVPELRGSDKNKQRGLKRILSRDLLITNILLPLAFFMLMLQLYALQQWGPALIVEIGHTVDQGTQYGVVISVFSAIGMLMFGLLVTKFQLKRVETIMSVLAGIAMVSLAWFTNSPFLVFLSAAAFAAVLNSGLMTGLYALAPGVYPVAARAAGISFAIGVARFGTMVGPWLAGQVLERGYSVGTLFIVIAIPLFVPAFVVNLIPYINVEKQV